MADLVPVRVVDIEAEELAVLLGEALAEGVGVCSPDTDFEGVIDLELDFDLLELLVREGVGELDGVPEGVVVGVLLSDGVVDGVPLGV